MFAPIVAPKVTHIAQPFISGSLAVGFDMPAFRFPTNCAPSAWILQYSNDMVNWTNVAVFNERCVGTNAFNLKPHLEPGAFFYRMKGI